MKLKLLNNILPKQINRNIIDELVNSNNWFIARDTNKSRFEKIFSNINSGFGIETIVNGRVVINSILNLYGEIIFNIIIEKLKIKAEINRLYWNMYLKNSDGEYHKDNLDLNYISVVYNLHTTDGGTDINHKFYKDLEGQAKIFNSNILHKGIGPKQDNVRFNLNLVLLKK